MTSEQVCDFAGCTYRQLDFWVRKGHIPGVDHLRGTGSGIPREWRHREAVFVRALVRLVRAGLKVDVAAKVLAPHAGHVDDVETVTLPGGLTLSLQPRLQVVSA